MLLNSFTVHAYFCTIQLTATYREHALDAGCAPAGGSYIHLIRAVVAWSKVIPPIVLAVPILVVYLFRRFFTCVEEPRKTVCLVSLSVQGYLKVA